ncbi:hypothetical protein ACWCQN_43610 [Streptomyces sp. NPDC001984]
MTTLSSTTAHFWHFWPGIDRAASVANARAAFGGEVLAAEENFVVALGTSCSGIRPAP